MIDDVDAISAALLGVDDVLLLAVPNPFLEELVCGLEMGEEGRAAEGGCNACCS